MHCKAHGLHLNSLHKSPRARKPMGRQKKHRHMLRTWVSPCSNPMRNLEEAMKARCAEVMWVSSGVSTVRNPQADADSRRTFSPPILEHRNHPIKTKGRAKGQSPPVKTQGLFPVQPVFKSHLSVKPVLLSQMSLAPPE